MARSYKEILAKVQPIYEAQPERFTKFYDRITVLLSELKPGTSILIAEHCTARSMELFMDVAEMVIIEDLMHRDATDGVLEFSHDRKSIRRTESFKPSKNLFSYCRKGKDYPNL